MASQSSPEELDAAYTRVESRCAESISRCASPCNSQYGYSNYSSECPTPVSPTFSQPTFPSIVIPNQDYSTGLGFTPYGNGSTSAVECTGTETSGGWGWGNQVVPQVSESVSSQYWKVGLMQMVRRRIRERNKCINREEQEDIVYIT